MSVTFLTNEDKIKLEARLDALERGGGTAEGAVLYTEQTLTDEQKAQARANIGAIQIPCITGTDAPTTATEGAVGCLYMDTSNGDIYKCTAVSDTTYTWEALVTSGGGNTQRIWRINAAVEETENGIVCTIARDTIDVAYPTYERVHAATRTVGFNQLVYVSVTISGEPWQTIVCPLTSVAPQINGYTYNFASYIGLFGAVVTVNPTPDGYGLYESMSLEMLGNM